MNINFGLLPPITDFSTHGPDGKKLRGPDKANVKKMALCARALSDLDRWLAAQAHPIAAE